MPDSQGHTLQEAIRFALRQRNLSRERGFADLAAFWDNELWTLRWQVPRRPFIERRA